MTRTVRPLNTDTQLMIHSQRLTVTLTVDCSATHTYGGRNQTQRQSNI